MKNSRPPPRSRFGRRLLLAGGLLLLLIVLAGTGLWWSTRSPPQFYAEARQRDTARQAAEGDEFERRVLDTRNATRHAGDWTLVVTEEQLNAWLVHQLPREFPAALPDEFSDPRVSLTPDHLRIGVRYRSGAIDTILSLDVQLYLTEESRTVAAQLRSVRAGKLPLPPSRVLPALSAAARQLDLPLRWSQDGGDPVALWTFPERPAELRGRRLHLDRLELTAGQLVLRGRCE
ncbi:MAG: hypothetical protein U0935_13945 [Pirellulales bacterium]